MAARIESHVTVLYEVPDVAALHRVAAGIAPLRLHASHAMRWEEPGIYLAVEDPHGDLARFRGLVLGASDPGYLPHITLLHRESVGSPTQVEDAWLELRSLAPQVDFVVERLVVYEESGGAWRDLGEVRFQRSG
jgi:hypothetical protein